MSSKSDLLHLMPYESKNFDNKMNTSILTATIIFIKDTEKFEFFFFKKSVLLQLEILP